MAEEEWGGDGCVVGDNKVQNDQVKEPLMPKKNVRFVAVKTVAKPTVVKFRTKTGEIVSFKAVKTVKQKKVVQFRAKK